MEASPKEISDTCLRLFDQTRSAGHHLLDEDLKKSKPYDHEKPSGKYDDKNSYFNRANAVGYPLLQKGITGLSKIYYWELLKQITAFEKPDFKLNKGMVCANFGVSDLAEGDIDGGIAHLLWAGYEDRAWVSVSYAYDIFQMKLYTQFANGEQRSGLSQFGGLAPHIMLENAVKEYNDACSAKLKKDYIFNELKGSDEHRAILEGSLWTIARNLPLLTEENRTIFPPNTHNIYTRLRLFNGLVDLCRFIELRIRHHEKPPKNVRTLGDLLNHIFKGKSLSWFDKDVKSNIKTPQTGADFDDFVKSCLKLGFKARSILLLWGTRNYSVHVCDPETPYVFNNFEKIFNAIVGAYTFYLQFKGIV
jgi:hypothetical protein